LPKILTEAGMFLWRALDRRTAGELLQHLGRSAAAARPPAEGPREPAAKAPKPASSFRTGD
jgi:hypothetical protein